MPVTSTAAYATTVSTTTPVAQVTGTVSLAAVSPSAPAVTDPTSTLPEGIQQIRDFLFLLTPERAIALAWQVLPGVAAGLAVGFSVIYGRRWLLRWLDRAPLPSADTLASAKPETTSRGTAKNTTPPASTALPPTWRFWASQVLHGLQPWFIGLLSITTALGLMPFPDGFHSVVGHVAAIATIIQLGIMLNRLLAHAAQRYLASYPDDGARITTVTTLVMIAGILVWAVVLLMLLANLGVDITALVAGLGIGGVALAFASQNLLQSIFASMSTVFDSPLALGDFIISGSTVGTVERIALRSTFIRALSGEQIIVPNSELFGGRIQNFGRMQERRVVFTFSIEYGAAPEQLQNLALKVKSIIQELPDTRFDRCHFHQFGENGLNFETVFIMTKADYNLMMDRLQSINLALLSYCNEQGLSFAVPTRRIVVENPGTSSPTVIDAG